MGNPAKTHKSTSILHLQRHIHLSRSKRTIIPKHIGSCLQLNQPLGPPLQHHNANLHPPPHLSYRQA